MAGEPDPKPTKPFRATPKEWEALREQLVWRCIACGKDWRPALSTHHIVGRDRGGDDVIENLVVLCGYTEASPNGCHVRLQEHRPGWEQIAGRVRAWVMARASRYGYVVGKLGIVRFDQDYPSLPFLAIGDLARAEHPDVDLQRDYGKVEDDG